MKRSQRWMRALVSLVLLFVTLAPAPSAFAGDRLAAPLPDEPASQRATAGPPPPEDDGPWVVRAYYTDVKMVRALAAWHDIWETRPEAGYVVLDVDQDEYARLLAAGFRVEIDARLTAELRAPNVRLPGQVAGIPGYPCYRTVEETFNTAEAIAAAYPNLASWIDGGDSWEKVTPGGNAGYDLLVLKLTNETIPGPKPAVFIMSSVHAREYTPAELNTRFAEYLVANYDVDPDVTWLLDYHEIHLLLQANPDGRKKAEAGLSWRKNTNENYCSPTSNYRGADLNRNYEFQWGCCGGSSGDPCDLTYRGPAPASEPETQMVQDYVRAQFPDQREDDLASVAPLTTTGVFLDLHSYSELVLWSWGFTADPAPNSAALRTLGRKFAYFNGYEPNQSMTLYPTDGTTDDFAYGELGLAAYTFELGTAFFQNCSVFENTILPDNLPALFYAAKSARAPYMTPSGPDALNVTALPSGVMPGAVVALSATLDDTRFNNQVGAEPTQPIAAAEFYIDVPPWEDTAVAHPMAATDGAFDTTVEAVGATVDTTGLSEGRHILYVRGRDADGNWGVVSAAFLYVLDPATSPVIEGYVRDANNRAPLTATVTAGMFQADTHPATGYYSMTVVSGTYTVQAIAANYAITAAGDVMATSGAHQRQDFFLYPLCEIFADDVESGNAGWTAPGNWAITTESSHSPTHAWTDSPGANYGNNWNYALTSPVFDLSAYSGVTLDFWHRYDLEDGYDYGYLEYSTNGGTTWSQLASYNGEDETTWRQEAVALSAVDGQANARLRFRLDTDSYEVHDGWYIDDIVLAGGGSACPSTLLAPTAGFTSTAPVMAGAPVAFTNLSVGTLPMTYHWDFGDGSSAMESDPQHAYIFSGTFTVTLAVTNSLGSDSISHTVEILPRACQPLSITALTSDAPVFVGEPAHFTATVSGDPLLVYAWDFGGAGDGAGLDGPTPVYTYTSPGEYLVTLDVTDGCWAIDSAGISVTIDARPVTAWEKAVAINGTPVEAFPAPVIAGDIITVEERVTITSTANVTYTLHETWTASLDLVGWSNAEPGGVTRTGNALTWAMVNVTPTLAYTLAKTFVVLPGVWTTDAITGSLWVENALPQPLGRVLLFDHLNAAIEVEPQALTVATGRDDVVTRTLAVSNTGDAPLTWSLAADPAVAWLAVTPPSGSVAPGAAERVTLTLTAPPTVGTYTTTLRVNSNDPAAPPVSVPVTLQVLLAYDFVVTPGAAAQSGLPGHDVRYTFHVTNTGLHADVLSVTLDGGTWAVVVPAEVGPLPAGESTTLPVTVTVPALALCGDSDVVTVTATSQGDPAHAVSALVTTTARAVYGVLSGAGEPASSGDPGQTVSYTVAMTNTGNCVDTFALYALGAWPTAAPSSVGPLSAGAGDVVTVAVTIPADALAHMLDVTTLRAVSQGDAVQDATLALTTTANTVYAAALAPPSLALDGPPGTDVVYTFVLSNTGNITDAFALDVEDAVWPVTLSPTITLLGPGDMTPVAVTVTIPLTTALSMTDTGRLVVSGTGVAVYGDFTTTALIRHEVALYAMPVTRSAGLGELATYVVTATNTGNIADVFTVTLSDAAWPAVFAPETVALEPGEAAPVVVTVTVPLTATPGATDAVTVTATSHSDATVSDSLRLTTEALCVEVSGAWFTYAPAAPLVGQTVTFTGGVGAGTLPVTFVWDFGDGGAGAGPLVTHTFPVETALLPYTVVMTASNVCSAQAVWRVIEVQPHRVYLPFVVRQQ